jgi:hypothetical protein
MKKIILICLSLLLPIVIKGGKYDDEYNVEGFYVKVDVKYNTFAKTSDGEIKKIDYVLTETTDIKDGTYSVTLVEEEDDKLYNIRGTDLYILMDWFKIFVVKDAILKVTSYSGYKFGKIILED